MPAELIKSNHTVELIAEASQTVSVSIVVAVVGRITAADIEYP